MTAPPTPGSDVISVRVDDAVATVWLDRPRKLNALGPAFWDDFPEIVRSLSADAAVRVIVVAGRGEAFTVGLDLEAFAGAVEGGTVADRQHIYAQVKAMQQACSSLAESPKPVIAVTHGWCLGAGIDLITAADIRICTADSVFSIRETKIAMVADVGTLQRLPAIVGPGNTADLVYSGRDIGAEEALAMGLVSKVLPDHEAAMTSAHALAGEIAGNSPLAVQGAKTVLRNSDGMSIEQRLDYIALWNAAFITSEDFAEAFTAFAEHRPPRFSGR